MLKDNKNNGSQYGLVPTQRELSGHLSLAFLRAPQTSVCPSVAISWRQANRNTVGISLLWWMSPPTLSTIDIKYVKNETLVPCYHVRSMKPHQHVGWLLRSCENWENISHFFIEVYMIKFVSINQGSSNHYLHLGIILLIAADSSEM